jgi:hypothetical protein
VLIEHPAVAEAAVVPSPDPVRLAVPKAYVILARPAAAATAPAALSILASCASRLAPYKRVRRLEFAELPKTISGKIRRVERYHSLIVDRKDFPKDLEVTAETGDIIMGLRHKTLPIHGVQFHPESIASEHGHKILENFLKIAGDHPSQQNKKKAA